METTTESFHASSKSRMQNLLFFLPRPNQQKVLQAAVRSSEYLFLSVPQHSLTEKKEFLITRWTLQEQLLVVFISLYFTNSILHHAPLLSFLQHNTAGNSNCFCNMHSRELALLAVFLALITLSGVVQSKSHSPTPAPATQTVRKYLLT
jgi:hypothetical protein